ncbi:retinol dehydrogenase 11 [Selaginella moellendorffii]|uniref:retinol dehydrogenase 11 n=1 Tax=Selaginella moellendorffii TaxID=88036 RepID=UPI000D1C8298|nr:retinol dehydrogenase 11 [Selaginella moellendorffii]|eukprot:XP_024520754.1 retinol dehydrogenase 11 [Selaginella moellendorffii]
MVLELWRMGVVWTLVLLCAYFRLLFRLVFGRAAIYPRCAPASHCARACIVTGASSGIGKATAEILALEGYHVVLAGRSLANLEKAAKELHKTHEDLLLYPMELDLCSVPSILRFVKSVEEWLGATQVSLQLLVNNAGIFAATPQCTSDGYDRVVMTNYLGPYILTQLLLPKLQNSSHTARIVNVVSFTHRSSRKLPSDFWKMLGKKKLDDEDNYRMAMTYEVSKLYELLWTYQLHRKYLRVSVMAADPGVVETKILRELPWWLVQFAFMMLKGVFLLQSPRCGARAVVDAALAPMEVSGKYFFGGNGFTLPSSALSRDEKLAKRLWSLTEEAYAATMERYTAPSSNLFRRR